MMQRIDSADGAAAVSVLGGLLALFLPWYGYASSGSHITVNGFRASLLGDVFFLVIATVALLLLVKWEVIDERAPARQQERTTLNALAATAGATVVLQLILDLFAGGRSIGVGLVLALLSAAGLVLAARLRGSGYTPRLSRGSAA